MLKLARVALATLLLGPLIAHASLIGGGDNSGGSFQLTSTTMPVTVSNDGTVENRALSNSTCETFLAPESRSNPRNSPFRGLSRRIRRALHMSTETSLARPRPLPSTLGNR